MPTPPRLDPERPQERRRERLPQKSVRDQSQAANPSLATTVAQHASERHLDSYATPDHQHIPTFVERFESFNAVGAAAWEEFSLALGPFFVPSGSVCQVIMQNSHATQKRFAGVRAKGSSLERRIDMGPADVFLPMLVTADPDSIIEIYAENVTDITFYLLGFWSRS